MKSMLMAVMAVAVAVTFSAPAFAEDNAGKKKQSSGGHVVMADDQAKKKDAPKADETFGDKPAEAPKKPK